MKTEKPNNHFFASSIAQWATTTDHRDLRDLIKLMDQDGYAYSLFLVPGSHEANYEIRMYQPQVEGTQWVGYFEPKKTAKKRAAIKLGGQLLVIDPRQAEAPCYACLYPEDGEDEALRCATTGILAPVTGVIGCMQAVEALAETGEVFAGQAGDQVYVH